MKFIKLALEKVGISTDISLGGIYKILISFDFKPWKVRYYLNSVEKGTEEYEEKVKAINSLYRLSNAYIEVLDERNIEIEDNFSDQPIIGSELSDEILKNIKEKTKKTNKNQKNSSKEKNSNKHKTSKIDKNEERDEEIFDKNSKTPSANSKIKGKETQDNTKNNEENDFPILLTPEQQKELKKYRRIIMNNSKYYFQYRNACKEIKDYEKLFSGELSLEEMKRLICDLITRIKEKYPNVDVDSLFSFYSFDEMTGVQANEDQYKKKKQFLVNLDKKNLIIYGTEFLPS